MSLNLLFTLQAAVVLIKYPHMKRTIEVFNSFAEAEEANKEYYRSLSPNQRIALLLVLRDQYRPYPNEVTEGFKRVCRIIKRS